MDEVTDPGVGPARRPGRPRQSDEDAARVRASIVDAAERVFADGGYRSMTAGRLIEAANLSRTNFYRYFRSPDQPLEEVLARFIGDLTSRVELAVTPYPYGAARVVAGIDAFLDWSRRWQHLLPSVTADLHDPSSPVSRARREGVDSMLEILTRDYDDSGRAGVPDRTALDIFVNGLEYTAYRLVVDTAVGPADVENARGTMLRIAMALLGEPQDWRNFADATDALETSRHDG